MLIADKKLVYFFDTSSLLTEGVNAAIRSLLLEESGPEAYILVDETQDNPTADVWIPLVKNTSGHNITTIGAGVPKFSSMSGRFKNDITTDRLFLSSSILVSEKVLEYFYFGSTAQYQRDQIELLIEEIRSYVGGHIYPLMSLTEQLVPAILNGATAEHQIQILHSSHFHGRSEFKDTVQRIQPAIQLQDFRALLTLSPASLSLTELQRHGLVDEKITVITQFLFDEYVKSQTGNAIYRGQLASGVDGVQQLLQFAWPNMEWEQYNNNGGPIKDAMTFELLLALSRVSALDTRLFNPKLDSYKAGRKPGLYINTTVDSYVECVLTMANSDSERKKLDEHISRFYWEDYYSALKHRGPPYYPVGEASFAVLNFRDFGVEPMKPFDNFFNSATGTSIYEERVFTLVMPTKCSVLLA